jgi:hypothetical protein
MAKRKQLAEQSVEITSVEDVGPQAYAGAGSSPRGLSHSTEVEKHYRTVLPIYEE